MGTRDILWYLFLGSLIAFILGWVYFTMQMSDAYKELGISGAAAPFETLKWMFDPSNPLFMFVIVVVAVMVLSIGILKFGLPAPATVPMVAATAAAPAAVGQTAVAAVRQAGGYLRRFAHGPRGAAKRR
jgi:hypothetical protein